MSHLPIYSRAPSNIALIKYMGKKDFLENEILLKNKNIAENPSLSLTLNHFCTTLKMQLSLSDQDEWTVDGEKEEKKDSKLIGYTPTLSDEGIKRFLNFVEVLRSEVIQFFNPENQKKFGVSLQALTGICRPVSIISKNTFPHSAGIASSASSFSALTYAFFHFYFYKDHVFIHFLKTTEGRIFLSLFSRMGSGSSARSFDGPFVSLEGGSAYLIPSQMPKLKNLLLVAGKNPKSISSSVAHLRCKSSPIWSRRMNKIFLRHDEMKKNIANGDFKIVSHLAYEEFLEMHELFHTCQEPFTYFNKTTEKLLEVIKENKEHLFSKVIFTMDAGPNIHCLVREEDFNEIKNFWSSRFSELEMMSDEEGLGACLI